MKTPLSLDDQLKKAEVLYKVTEIKEKRHTMQLDRDKFEYDKQKRDSDVDKVRAIEDIITTFVFDKKRTIMPSEPALKNAFSKKEIQVLKDKALEIIKRF